MFYPALLQMVDDSKPKSLYTFKEGGKPSKVCASQYRGAKLRFLILSCTDRKLSIAEPIPALERYDGPIFRIVRRYLRAHAVLGQELIIAILSAQLGLIGPETLIAPYDQRMTATQADQLRPQVIAELQQLLLSHAQPELFLLMGREYQRAVEPLTSWLPKEGRITIAKGGSGRKQQQLVSWLYQQPETKPIQSHFDYTPPKVQTGQAVIRGVKITTTPSAIEAQVKSWLTEGDEGHHRTKDWIAYVGPYQVSPKWLVSRLSGLPVSAFAADEARRVLMQLGIAIAKY